MASGVHIWSEPVTEHWPWDQSPETAVFTERAIINDGASILHVSHDIDDHGWQFLGWGDTNIEGAAIVGLAEIVEIDPTVIELADLPPGWRAWRKTKFDPWTREPSPTPEDEGR